MREALKEYIKLEEVMNALMALDDLFKAIPIKRRAEYLGHLNSIALVLEKLERIEKI